MSDDLALLAFIILAVAALSLDALIPARKGDWRKSPASAADVADIVAGKSPKSEPRHELKLSLLLVVVLGIAFVFGGKFP